VTDSEDTVYHAACRRRVDNSTTEVLQLFSKKFLNSSNVMWSGSRPTRRASYNDQNVEILLLRQRCPAENLSAM